MTPPTKRQRQCERAIVKLTVDGVPPTYDELAVELGITRGAARMLAIGLQKRGRISIAPGAARSIELLDKGRMTASAA